MPRPSDRTSIERRLRARRTELDERIGQLAKPPERGAGISFGKRVGDGTSEAVSRMNEVGVANSLLVTSQRVDRALEKLEDGSYGFCDACGKPIPPGRLEVAPESVRCMQCARADRS